MDKGRLLNELKKQIAKENCVPESWVKIFVDKDGSYTDFAIIKEV